MKLFLTSSCVSENLREAFLAFLGKPASKVKLYFVPTACDVEENKFFISKSMDDLAVCGVNPIWYSLRYKTREQVAHELTDADMIWVNGGNTFYLLDVARKCGFMDVVQDLVRNKGVMYGGTSAGTILATPSIEIAGWGDAWDENAVGLRDLTSFGFTSFLTHVHYHPQTEKTILLSHKKEPPIYAIPDGCAVEVLETNIFTHGPIEIL